MIPKKLHYISLFYKDENLALRQKCLDSWKSFLPEYELIEWNENNIDLKAISAENKFVKQCVKRELWPFVSDFLRVKILIEHGGIYLDTDVEVLKRFEDLRNYRMFIGLESHDRINGAVIGCEANHPVLIEMKRFYDEQILTSKLFIIPEILTHVLKGMYQIKTFENEVMYLEDIVILPTQYFYPYHFTEKFTGQCIKSETHTIHWWHKENSWSQKNLNYLLTKHMSFTETIRHYLWKILKSKPLILK